LIFPHYSNAQKEESIFRFRWEKLFFKASLLFVTYILIVAYEWYSKYIVVSRDEGYIEWRYGAGAFVYGIILREKKNSFPKVNFFPLSK